MFQALWRLRSQRCRFTVIDAPGHDDFTKDIVTAMSQADIAVLVVSAVQADLVTGIGYEGQVREHALLAYTLGLRQIVVCVNKMDCDDVAYSEGHFVRACASVRQDLEDVGLKTHDVHFVPISGLAGDNVKLRSDKIPWYSGPTLLEAMDDAVASHFKPEYPLRFPLHDVMQIGGQGVVAVGRVATGSLRPGMDLIFAPGDIRAKVQSIRMHHESLSEAVCGESVNVAVDVPMKELRRGMVGSAADDSPASECSSFLARVIVLPPSLGRERPSREIAKDCTLVVECHTAQVPCRFEELLSRTDRRTGKVIETHPSSLHAGDAAFVRLRPEAPFCVEAFSEYPPLGRFAVRDQKTTVAVGVVQQVDSKVGFSSPVLRCREMPSRLTSKRHSTSKASPHSRSSPGGGMSCQTDLCPRVPLFQASCKRMARPKLEGTASNLRQAGTDSGEDSPTYISPDRPLEPRSPFLAFGAVKNSSPFAAFGAVNDAKVRNQTSDLLRRACAPGAEGTGESDG